MPTKEMGRSATARSEPLTSSEIEELEGLVDRYENGGVWEVGDDARMFAAVPRLLTSLKSTAEAIEAAAKALDDEATRMLETANAAVLKPVKRRHAAKHLTLLHAAAIVRALSPKDKNDARLRR